MDKRKFSKSRGLFVRAMFLFCFVFFFFFLVLAVLYCFKNCEYLKKNIKYLKLYLDGLKNRKQN
jgi:hypothetical protein